MTGELMGEYRYSVDLVVQADSQDEADRLLAITNEQLTYSIDVREDLGSGRRLYHSLVVDISSATPR